ncbi:MAG: MMPL family transporter [Mariprofundales bacterium]
MKSHHLFAAVLISSLLLSVALLVNFKTDISDFFFRGDSPETELIASAVQSGEISHRYILLIESKHQDAEFKLFTQDLQDKIVTVAGIKVVRVKQKNAQAFEEIIADYLPYNKQLFSTNPKDDIENLFQQKSLDERAKQLKKTLLSQESSWLTPLVIKDPLMLTGDWVSKLGFEQSETKIQTFSSLIVETTVSGLDAQAQRPIYMSIKKAFDAVNAAYQGEFSLRITGVPLFSMTVQEQVSQDLKLVSIISASLIFLLFMVVFRSIMGLAWILFILVCAIAASSVLTSLIFGYIHSLTIAIGSTLIGVCVDYPIHAMVHASGEKNAHESTKRIWPSLLLGGLTTAVGYISLSFTNHPGLQQLALFAGIGIGVALLLTRYLLPHFMHGHIHKMKIGLNLSAWLTLIHRNRLPMQSIVLGAALFLFAVGFPNLEWTDDMRKLSPSLASLKVEDQAIRNQVSSIEAGRFILIQASSFESGLQRNEVVFAKLQVLKDEGVLKSFHSIYPWLASKKLQQENIRVFNENITSEHQEMWQKSLHKEGLSVKYLGQLSVAEPIFLSKDKLESWPHKSYVSGQYLVNDGQVLIMTWLGVHDVEKIKTLVSSMEGVSYISQGDIVNNLAAEYRTQTMDMLWIGACAILLLLLIRFRNLFTAINILFPAIVSVCVVMAIWGNVGVAMGMLHLIGLLLAIAICVDYAIFFHENRACNQQLTFQAIVVSSMTTVLAFVSLGFADNPALQAMAWTVAPSVLLGFLLCPLLVRQQQKKLI